MAFDVLFNTPKQKVWYSCYASKNRQEISCLYLAVVPDISGFDTVAVSPFRSTHTEWTPSLIGQYPLLTLESALFLSFIGPHDLIPVPHWTIPSSDTCPSLESALFLSFIGPYDLTAGQDIFVLLFVINNSGTHTVSVTQRSDMLHRSL